MAADPECGEAGYEIKLCPLAWHMEMALGKSIFQADHEPAGKPRLTGSDDTCYSRQMIRRKPRGWRI